MSGELRDSGPACVGVAEEGRPTLRRVPLD
jgi:hypothetical protein